MESSGIGRSMLSISSPGMHLGDDGAAAELARHINDVGAALVAAHPDRSGTSRRSPCRTSTPQCSSAELPTDAGKGNKMIMLQNVRVFDDQGLTALDAVVIGCSGSRLSTGPHDELSHGSGMRVVGIEEHWTTEGIDRALRAQPAGVRDESLALNDRGDMPARLFDIGEGRIAAMDAAGVDVQILSLSPPGTHGLPAREAITLSREANHRMSEAVGRHPTRLRAMTTLPMSDPDAAVAELQLTASDPAHVGIMSYPRSGERTLDDPAYDDLFAAAAGLRRPIYIHPQIAPNAVQETSYRGFDPTLDLGLATFGWGWHVEAGLAALRLIVRGTFDRHPNLQVVVGHWGEMLLFALDRVDSLSTVAHLERRVAEYFQTNIHIATSGMLVPRLLRHALDYVSIDRILLSIDYPFHRPDAAAITDFLATLPDPEDQRKIAHGNAESLYGLSLRPSTAGDRTARPQEDS